MMQWETSPAARAVAAPAGIQLPADDQGFFLHIKTLNAGLVNEIGQLRSQLAFSIEHNAKLLQRLNDQQEAARAAALKVMEKLAVKVNSNHQKTAEAVGLKVFLEESVREKDEVLLKFNKLKVKFSHLEEENEHLKLELKEKESLIKELGQKQEPTQSQENLRETWTWFTPLTTMIVVASALVYAAR